MGVVLDERAGRALEVPEQCRRDRMATRPELGFPAAPRHLQAAADHLMEVAHGESNVVQAALGLRRLQQEEVVVAAARRAAQEMAAAGIAVREMEAQRLVELGRL